MHPVPDSLAPVSTFHGGIPVRHRAAFWFRHLVLPLIGWCGLMLWASGLHGDFWLADRIYASGGQAWALHSNVLVEQWLHLVGKKLSALAWLLVALAWLCSLFRPAWRAWRCPLGKLALSVLLSTTAVALAKQLSGIDCPWDLSRYGGTHAYRGLLDAPFSDAATGACFPAGHASAGYAWLALYFFFAAVHPRWRWYGLAAGWVAGLAFGLAQQLRGAHFLSHDLATAMLCWIVALLVHCALPSRDGAPA